MKLPSDVWREHARVLSAHKREQEENFKLVPPFGLLPALLMLSLLMPALLIVAIFWMLICMGFLGLCRLSELLSARRLRRMLK